MKTNGIATAVALAGGVGTLAEGDVSQDDLFEADTALPLSPAPRSGSGPKGGRPAGTRNRATEEARQFFLRRYRSPLIGLGEIYSRAPEALARELSLTRVVEHLAPGQEAIREVYDAEGQRRGHLVWDRLKAFEMQRDCMVAALPYVERKQPIAIDTDGKVAGVIVIGEMAGLSDAGDGVLTLDLEPEQNQQVSDEEDDKSDGDKSDERSNSMKSQTEFKE